jgi:hypothetical protein
MPHAESFTGVQRAASALAKPPIKKCVMLRIKDSATQEATMKAPIGPYRIAVIIAFTISASVTIMADRRAGSNAAHDKFG